MQASCLQMGGLRPPPTPPLFLAVHACLKAYAICTHFRKPVMRESCWQMGGLRPPPTPPLFLPCKGRAPPYPPCFLKPCKFASKHIYILHISIYTFYFHPPTPRFFLALQSLLQSTFSETHHARIVFAKGGEAAPPPTPPPPLFLAVQVCFQAYIYIYIYIFTPKA